MKQCDIFAHIPYWIENVENVKIDFCIKSWEKQFEGRDIVQKHI